MLLYSFSQTVTTCSAIILPQRYNYSTKKKKKDLITDKTLLLFHKEHLQQMLRDKQKQNNCRLEDTESKKN